MFLGHADDAMEAAGEVHKIAAENDMVRVLEVVIPPGYKISSHWHPKHILYSLESATMRFTVSGATPVEQEIIKGQVIENPELTHTAENIGTTEARFLIVEFKS
jgi:oxalate decarboxylase/phosphoglucose isomerase-like protein (cupin superfamily)